MQLRHPNGALFCLSRVNENEAEPFTLTLANHDSSFAVTIDLHDHANRWVIRDGSNRDEDSEAVLMRAMEILIDQRDKLKAREENRERLLDEMSQAVHKYRSRS